MDIINATVNAYIFGGLIVLGIFCAVLQKQINQLKETVDIIDRHIMADPEEFCEALAALEVEG